MVATENGKKAALEALAERRANKPDKIDNASLKAGQSMYFYCKSCGHLSDILSESYIVGPKRLCGECKALKDIAWLDE